MKSRQPCRDRCRAARIGPVIGLIAICAFPLIAQDHSGLVVERKFASVAGNCLPIGTGETLQAVIACGDDTLRAGIDYVVSDGRLCLLAGRTGCDSATAVLGRDYSLIGRTFALREYGTAGALAQTPSPQTSIAAAPVRSQSKLKVSGSKSFYADVSDRGRSNLSQGLTMSVTGEIAPGVLVRGSFSDRGLRDNRLVTRRFSELENVYLEVESPRLHSVFGSFPLRRDRFRFLTMERRVQGLELEYRQPRVRTEASVSVPQGNFLDNQFTTEDGNYGPYRLRDRSGNPGIAVVENSDVVWLNGIKLQRGRDQDYYIDYLRGELFFTGRRVLDSGDRVRVEFEFQRLEYRKTMFTGGAQLSGSDSANLLAFGYAGVIGARNDPLDFELTESDIAALTAAGDDPAAAVVSGAKLVGMGAGDYRVETDSAGSVRYEYVGESNGDYRVAFSESEGGEYQYLGSGRYEYVGAGLGRYAPIRRLPLPEAAQAVASTGSIALNSNLTLAGELAYSNYDRNRFSARDDHDNAQAAGFGQLEYRQHNRFVTVKIAAEYLPAQFYRFSRMDQVDDDYLWQRSSSRQRDRKRYDAAVALRPDSTISAELLGGITREGAGLRSERAGVRFSSSGRLNLAANLAIDAAAAEEAGLERKLIRIKPEVRTVKLPVVLLARGEYDQRRSQAEGAAATTLSKREIEAGGESGGVTLTGRLRENWENSGRWQVSDSKRSVIAQVARSLGGNGRLNATGSANRYRGGSARQDYQTGMVDLLAPVVAGGIDLTANYRLNRRGVSQSNQTYLKVDEGEGDYVLIDSVYVPQARGDYILVTEQVGTATQSIDAEKRCALEVRLEKFLRSAATNGVSARYEVGLREIGAADAGFGWDWLVPPVRLFGDAETYSQRSDNYRLQRYDRGIGLRTEVSYTRNRDVNRLDLAFPGRRESEEMRAGLNQAIGDWGVVSGAVIGRNRTWRERGRLNLFLSERRIELGGTRYAGKFEYVLAATFAREHADSLDLESTSWRIAPGLNCNLGAAGRIEAAIFGLQVSERSDRAVLLQMAEGFSTGTHYGGRIKVDIKLSETFVFKVLGNCELRAGEPNRYFLRSELVSRFE